MHAPDGDTKKEGRPADPWTFTAWTRRLSAPLVDSLARLLVRLRVHPHTLTVTGLLVALLSGLAIAKGDFRAGACLLLLSGGMDALDGALARMAGLQSPFGAFLDSFLDRYAEGAALLGLLSWASAHGRHGLILLTFVTMMGSIMVSYARARAEGLGFQCKVGLFSRLERFIVLTTTLLTGYLVIGFSVLAILTHVTAFQRMLHVYRQSR